MGFTVDGDLAAIHHLEQRRLRLGRGAVDFVGQNDVGENRAGLEHELLHVFVVDGDARHVTGQQVAGELHARERAIHRARQRIGQRCLAKARQVLDQQMPARGEADERPFDHVVLALYGLAHVGFEPLQRPPRLGHLLRDHELGHDNNRRPSRRGVNGRNPPALSVRSFSLASVLERIRNGGRCSPSALLGTLSLSNGRQRQSPVPVAASTSMLG